jgi:hypothetical protein
MYDFEYDFVYASVYNLLPKTDSYLIIFNFVFLYVSVDRRLQLVPDVELDRNVDLIEAAVLKKQGLARMFFFNFHV